MLIMRQSLYAGSNLGVRAGTRAAWRRLLDRVSPEDLQDERTPRKFASIVSGALPRSLPLLGVKGMQGSTVGLCSRRRGVALIENRYKLWGPKSVEGMTSHLQGVGEGRHQRWKRGQRGRQVSKTKCKRAKARSDGTQRHSAVIEASEVETTAHSPHGRGYHRILHRTPGGTLQRRPLRQGPSCHIHLNRCHGWGRPRGCSWLWHGKACQMRRAVGIQWRVRLKSGKVNIEAAVDLRLPVLFVCPRICFTLSIGLTCKLLQGAMI